MTEKENKLFCENLGLVGFTIDKYTNKELTSRNPLYDAEDVYQVGCEGLVKAVRSYSKDLGPFSTYAVSRIRSSLSDCFAYQTRHEDQRFFGWQVKNDESGFVSEKDSLEDIFLTDTIHDLTESISECYRDDAKKLLSLISLGYSINDASEILGLKQSRAYHIIKQIKLKKKVA